MKKIVIDTSVLIEFARTKKGGYLKLKKLAGQGKVLLFTPTIVVFEFWSGDSMNKSENRQKGEEIFLGIEKIGLDEGIAKRAGELFRKEHVDSFDAIVASTALGLDACLATENIRHFSKIKGLKLYKSK